MPIHELAQLTWEEVRDLERGQTIVVLPVGAIEAHVKKVPIARAVEGARGVS